SVCHVDSLVGSEAYVNTSAMGFRMSIVASARSTSHLLSVSRDYPARARQSVFQHTARMTSDESQHDHGHDHGQHDEHEHDHGAHDHGAHEHQHEPPFEEQ